jgi:predicted DNA-binding transcriptional regulator AlpA
MLDQNGRGVDYVRSLKETAKIANMSTDTLRRLILLGRGPRIVRLSVRKVGIRDSDRQAWLSSAG